MMNSVSIGREAHNLTAMYTSALYVVGVSPVPCCAKATVLLPSHGRGDFSSWLWEDPTTAVVGSRHGREELPIT
ncbi:hypothetical protein [Bacteroides xylanisolvens]|uniref:hypothetical protein n=1 Tax=Bacteroides xylanisolvens TaxID=371601 RepID=UPI00189C4358|nr:hypothetical protein [Bacteroides xylanisolvens]